MANFDSGLNEMENSIENLKIVAVDTSRISIIKIGHYKDKLIQIILLLQRSLPYISRESRNIIIQVLRFANSCQIAKDNLSDLMDKIPLFIEELSKPTNHRILIDKRLELVTILQFLVVKWSELVEITIPQNDTERFYEMMNDKVLLVNLSNQFSLTNAVWSDTILLVLLVIILN